MLVHQLVPSRLCFQLCNGSALLSLCAFPAGLLLTMKVFPEISSSQSLGKRRFCRVDAPTMHEFSGQLLEFFVAPR